MRQPKWSPEELRMIDVAKACVEKHCGVPEGKLRTLKVQPSAVVLQGPTGILFRHIVVEGVWELQELGLSRWNSRPPHQTDATSG